MRQQIKNVRKKLKISNSSGITVLLGLPVLHLPFESVFITLLMKLNNLSQIF